MLRSAIYRAATAVAASVAPDEVNTSGEHSAPARPAQSHSHPHLALHQGEYQPTDGEALSLAVRSSRGRAAGSPRRSGVRPRGREPSRSPRSQRARPLRFCAFLPPQPVYLSDSDEGEPLIERYQRHGPASTWRVAAHYASCGIVSRYASVALDDSDSDIEREYEPVAARDRVRPSPSSPSGHAVDPSADSGLAVRGMDDARVVDERQLSRLTPSLSPAPPTRTDDTVEASPGPFSPVDGLSRTDGHATAPDTPPIPSRSADESVGADRLVDSAATVTGSTVAAPSPQQQPTADDQSAPPLLTVQVTTPIASPAGSGTEVDLPGETTSSPDGNQGDANTTPSGAPGHDDAPSGGVPGRPASNPSESSGTKSSHTRIKGKKKRNKAPVITGALAVAPARAGEDEAEAAAGGFSLPMQDEPDEFGFTASDAVRAQMEVAAREAEEAALRAQQQYGEPWHRPTFPLPRDRAAYPAGALHRSGSDLAPMLAPAHYAPTRGPDLPHFGFARDPWPAADPLDAFTAGYDFDHVMADGGAVPPGWGDGEELIPPMRSGRAGLRLLQPYPYQMDQQPFTSPVVPPASTILTSPVGPPSMLLPPVPRMAPPPTAKSVAPSTGGKKRHHGRARSRSASSYAVTRPVVATGDAKAHHHHHDGLVPPKANRPRAASSSVVEASAPSEPSTPSAGPAVPTKHTSSTD